MNFKQLLLLFLFFGIPSEEISLVTRETIPLTSVAGDALKLEFVMPPEEAILLLKNAYGSTILKAEGSNTSIFKIPRFMYVKSGLLNWKLLGGDKTRLGTIDIQPRAEPRVIETYFGPRSIQAGERDFSMLVSIPTDSLDNPLADGTLVEISDYFQGNLVEEQFEMLHMFAWKNIYTRKKSGKITVATASKNISGKEMISTVYPSLATNFNINASSEHLYADGNQVLRIKTSIIKDDYDNLVSDGTSVEFIIENNEGMKLKSVASTIDGIATAQLLHPQEKDTWTIYANVTGMAVSSPIRVTFKPVLEEIPVQQMERNIRVGPLKSYLAQLLPDGASVELIIELIGGEVHRHKAPTEDGMVNFIIPETISMSEITGISIRTMGVIRKLKL